VAAGAVPGRVSLTSEPDAQPAVQSVLKANTSAVHGSLPIGIGLSTAFVFGSIRTTVPAARSDTQTPSGVTATRRSPPNSMTASGTRLELVSLIGGAAGRGVAVGLPPVHVPPRRSR
jgi:hypothetical protein